MLPLLLYIIPGGKVYFCLGRVPKLAADQLIGSMLLMTSDRPGMDSAIKLINIILLFSSCISLQIKGRVNETQLWRRGEDANDPQEDQPTMAQPSAHKARLQAGPTSTASLPTAILASCLQRPHPRSKHHPPHHHSQSIVTLEAPVDGATSYQVYMIIFLIHLSQATLFEGLLI